jgi:hypothetical protein
LGLSRPAQAATERRAKALAASSPPAIGKPGREPSFMESDKMPIRTTSETVTFRRPFILSGLDKLQPAGTYTVDTEEEQLDAISFPAWKRIATVIALKNADAVEYQRIDPKELREALMRDGQQADPAEPLSPSSPKAQLNRARTARLARRKRF